MRSACSRRRSAPRPLLDKQIEQATTLRLRLSQLQDALGRGADPSAIDEGIPSRSARASTLIDRWSELLLEEERSDPPLFVARAGLDSAMVNVGLDAFVQAALQRNLPLDFMNHPRGDHAFECITDDPRTREIIRAALTFSRRQLGLESEH
jgi:hypothetical protein